MVTNMTMTIRVPGTTCVGCRFDVGPSEPTIEIL